MATGTRMEFGIEFGRAASGRSRLEPQAPLRVLVCADLAGPDGAARPPLRERRALRVDVDNLEQALGRIGAGVALAMEGGTEIARFESVDDFHPDRLLRRLAPFAALRQLRDELEDPARFEAAAAALGAAAPAPGSGSAAPGVTSDIERLLGARPAGLSKAPGPVRRADLDEWIRGIVAPHIVHDSGERRQMLVASVDSALARLMRAVLGDSGFRRLEAAWRGVDWLVREFGGEEAIEIHLLDVAPGELRDDVRASAADLSTSAIWQQLCGPQTEGPDAARWSIVVLDHAFDNGADDVGLLAGLAGVAASAGAALLAGADPRVLGCADARELDDPGAWIPPEAGAAARWAAIRGIDAARWIGLALPRVLMRLPYGAGTDPVEGFAFEEVIDPRDPASYLWGCPAWALALLAAAAFRERGWDIDLDSCLDLADLPAFSYRDGSEPKLRVCTEGSLNERGGERVLAQGVMPLLGRRDRGALRLMRWQSLAAPASRLHGPWS